jgi:hypothetical protein
MTSATNHWKLGLFVVTGLVIGLGALGWIGASRLQRETVDAFAYFDEPVGGLDVGSAVKFRGITVGKVAEIRVAPDRRHVEVFSNLFVDALERIGQRDPLHPQLFGDGTFAPPNLRVQLVSSALTGVTYLEADFVDPEKNPIPDYPFEVPWNTVHSARSTFRNLETGLMETLDSIPPLAARAERLLARVERGIDDLRVDDLANKIDGLLDAAHGLVRRIEDSGVIDAGKKSLGSAEKLIQEAREFLGNMRAPEGPVHKLAKSWEGAGENVRRAFAFTEGDVQQAVLAMRRMGDAVVGAADSVTITVAELRSDLERVRQAVGAVQRLADLLERDPGALLRGRAAPATIEGRSR